MNEILIYEQKVKTVETVEKSLYGDSLTHDLSRGLPKT
jgi:hypothetical protein